MQNVLKFKCKTFFGYGSIWLGWAGRSVKQAILFTTIKGLYCAFFLYWYCTKSCFCVQKKIKIKDKIRYLLFTVVTELVNYDFQDIKITKTGVSKKCKKSGKRKKKVF